MGKIVCDVCGTSYSEAATQCPICGCVNLSVNEQIVVTDSENMNAHPKYQHVKGGRFSTANVKKRNAQKPQVKETVIKVNEPDFKEEKAKKVDKSQKEKKNKSNRGLVITVLVLLLAIIAVIAYIAITFVLPVVMPEKSDTPATVAPTDAPAVSYESCEQLIATPSEILMTAIGETAKIQVSTVPAEVTDEILFFSGSQQIATVDANGVVTAVGEGETTITVVCGDISIDCAVSVSPAEVFAFDFDEVTFTAAGEGCVIYTGSLPLSEIVWRSDDESVATIFDGNVTAVGNGTTTVYGEYDGVVCTCAVTCVIETEPPTEPTTAADNGPYRLHNPHGTYDTDASIKVGVSFTLYLLDKDGNAVNDAVWTVEDGSSCKVSNGKVTGLAKGTSNVVATYGGERYVCIVRVS